MCSPFLLLLIAPQGNIVLAVEHCDGTASSARVARPVAHTVGNGLTAGWMFFAGLGDVQVGFLFC